MKRYIRIVLGLLIIGIGIFYILDFLCKAEVKCKNCPKISQNITESKRSGFYIGSYDSNVKVINLKNYNEKITLKNLWVENTWIRNTDNCLCSKYEKIKGYNVVLEFNKTNKKDFIFSLMPITEDRSAKNSYGIRENRKEMHFENLPTELKIVVEERNADENIGWQKKIVTDTIFLTLKKNEL